MITKILPTNFLFMRSKIFMGLIFSLSFFCAKAQTDTVAEVVQLSDLPLDKLLDVKVVTASGYLQPVSEAPSTITVITAQQIKDRGYEQLEDALRDVPGIDMIHINGYAPTLFYFRGMYGAENLRALLMIDGIVENNILGSNDMAGPVYSLHNVERIEVIWGPASALYGANAFGGVINIITKNGSDINGLHAEKGVGTFNTSFEKLSLGLKKSNYEYSVAGTLYNTDGPKFTNRDPQYHASFVDNAYSLIAAFSYYGKNSKTTIGYRTYNTPMGWGTYANSPTKYLGLPPQGNDNSPVLGILTRDINGQKPGLEDSYLRTAYIQNDFTPNEKLNILSRVTYRETGTGDDSYAYITVDGNRLIRANVTSYSNRIEGELTANYTLSKMHKFSAGIQMYQDNVEQGSRGTTTDTTIYIMNGKDTVTNQNSTFLPRLYDIRTNAGGYFQYVLNTNFLGKTSLTLGARDDYNSYFGNAFSPRVVIVNKPDNVLTFKLQYGNAFRAPTNLEIHGTADTFDLKTEKIRTWEANVIYSPSDNIRLQLNAFDNYLTDIIVLANLTGFNPDKNPGRITVNGLEGSFDMNFSKYISGFLNFTYQDTKGQNLITGVTRSVSAIARTKGNAGVTVHLPDDLLTVSITGNYVGDRPSPITDPYGTVPGYFLTNCVINTGRLFNKGISAGVEVRNVFNETWLDPGFRTADGTVFSTVLEQPGRTVLFKVSLDL